MIKSASDAGRYDVSDIEKMKSEAVKKIVTLEDFASIHQADMNGFKFVHSENHDETLDLAVHITNSRFRNCDFSELRSCYMRSNFLTNSIPPPMEILAEIFREDKDLLDRLADQ